LIFDGLWFAGVSDLAQHYLVKAGITAIRRVRKSDNNRIARACGATIVARTDEIQEKDIGTGCGLFEVKKLGDEYFTFLTECDNPKVGDSVAVHVHSRARSHPSSRIAVEAQGRTHPLRRTACALHQIVS
jgi:chaperonin GroEL (HSP60 family)